MMELQKITQVPEAPLRAVDSHKGTFGTVIVVGGSPGMIGAPAFCASAALRAGAGLAKVVVSPEILTSVLLLESSATGVALPERQVANPTNLIDPMDPQERAVLAVGPGMGRNDVTGQLLVTNLMRSRRPMVLDADGLTLLSQWGRTRPGEAPVVLTPHAGEFQRLAKPLGLTENASDEAERPIGAAKLAQMHRAVVVLKGHRTVVSDGSSVYLNHTGNPALATAGSGDVLTGMIAGLIAQGMTALQASILAVYLHGLAADLWAAEHGPSGLTASDLCKLIPAAFHRHRQRGAMRAG